MYSNATIAHLASLTQAQQTAEAVRAVFPTARGEPQSLLNEVDFGAVDGLDLETARKNTNVTVSSLQLPRSNLILDLQTHNLDNPHHFLPSPLSTFRPRHLSAWDVDTHVDL